MSKKWIKVACDTCLGAGMLQTLSGVEDCVCGGTGVMGYVTDCGTLAQYPGGPLMGRLGKTDLEYLLQGQEGEGNE